jgi:lysyl-tRNA synthetase class 1
MLLNLAIAANAEDKSVLWGFIRRYAPGASPEKNPKLDELAGYAVRYFVEQVKPTRKFRVPDEVEREALKKLDDVLAKLPANATPEEVQAALYDVGRIIPRYQDLKAKGATPEKPGVSVAWFNAIYQLLLGQERGPRFGSFVAVYGIPETRALIKKALAGELASS